MNVDKFGHHVLKRSKMNNYFDPSTALIDPGDGKFDAKNKIIKHIGNPIDSKDCVTKQYVDGHIENIYLKVKSINQTLVQLGSEINSLKQGLDSISSKNRKK